MKENAAIKIIGRVLSPLQHVKMVSPTQSLSLTCLVNYNKMTQHSVLSGQGYTSSKYDYPHNLINRGFHTSGPVSRVQRYIVGKTKGVSPTDLRGKLYDESDNVKENLDALETVALSSEATEQQLANISQEDSFQIYPDETTSDTLFNGIR